MPVKRGTDNRGSTVIVLQPSLDSLILFSGFLYLSHLWLKAYQFKERLLHRQFGKISLLKAPQHYCEAPLHLEVA